jgi:hypothetical protein
MTLRGEEVLVVPKLITGCKIWHLRREGSFYPKTSWCNTMASLPAGSEVG